MLNPTRWNPWMELAGLHRELDSMFNRVFGETVGPQSTDSFTPAADIRREDDKWKIWLALPGISPDKVEIDVTGGTLRVRGERTPTPVEPFSRIREAFVVAVMVSEASAGMPTRSLISSSYSV